MQTRVRIVKKYGNAEIEAFITHNLIGADMRLVDFESALATELGHELVKALAEHIGNPTLLLTKNGLIGALSLAMNDVLEKQIQAASDKVKAEMKQSTVTVAALNT